MDGGIEMRSRADMDPEQGNGNLPPVTEPSSLLRPRVKSQNRWFASILTMFVVAAAVYVVGGFYSNEEGTLIDKYDAHTGVVTNDFDSGKEAEKAFEQTQLQNNQANGPNTANGFWENHGKDNPFGNDNAVPHSGFNQTAFQKEHNQKAHAAAEARWNRTHPGKPFPGHGSISGVNHKGGHNANGNVPGGTTTGTLEGGHGGAAGTHNVGGLGGGDEHGNGHGGPTTEVKDQCEAGIIEKHGEWLNDVVSLRNGERYEVLEMLEHDKDAFT